METKDNLYKCTKCQIFQSKISFHKRNNKLGIRSVCKNCRIIERAENYNNNKEKELEYRRIYKESNPEKRRESSRKSAAKNLRIFRFLLNNIKNVPCLNCNMYFPPCAMDFDHRDPAAKLFNISEAQCINDNLLLEEIAKCNIICANCHRIVEHNRRHTKISYWNKIIYPYKEALCLDCNIKYPPYVMDFDHKNPKEKLFHISKPVAHNKKAIIEEIMKCDVVCANCHRIRTFIKKELI